MLRVVGRPSRARAMVNMLQKRSFATGPAPTKTEPAKTEVKAVPSGSSSGSKGSGGSSGGGGSPFWPFLLLTAGIPVAGLFGMSMVAPEYHEKLVMQSTSSLPAGVRPIAQRAMFLSEKPAPVSTPKMSAVPVEVKDVKKEEEKRKKAKEAAKKAKEEKLRRQKEQDELETAVKEAARVVAGEKEEEQLRSAKAASTRAGKSAKDAAAKAVAVLEEESGRSEVVEEAPADKIEAAVARISKDEDNEGEKIAAEAKSAKEEASKELLSARSEAGKATAEAMAAALEEAEAAAEAGGSVSGLGVDELRDRVRFLEDELRSRGRAEALRLNEFAKSQEGRWEAKFASFAEAQAAAVEASFAERAEAVKLAERADRESWARAEAERMASEINEQGRRAVLETLSALRDAESAASKARSDRMVALEAQAKGVKEGLGSRRAYEDVSRRVHRFELAVNALSMRLDAGKDATEEIEAIRVASGGDALVEALPFPEELFQMGLASRQKLAKEFDQAARAVERAALVPEGSGAAGEVLAATVSALLWGGSDAKSSPALTAKARETIATVAKARQAVEANDLAQAVHHLRQVQGYAAEEAQNWCNHAEKRLTAEQTLKVLRSYANLKAASLY